MPMAMIPVIMPFPITAIRIKERRSGGIALITCPHPHYDTVKRTSVVSADKPKRNTYYYL